MTPETPREAGRRKAIDDLYAVFAPDVVLEAEVEAILARIVAIDCAPATGRRETLLAVADELARHPDTLVSRDGVVAILRSRAAAGLPFPSEGGPVQSGVVTDDVPPALARRQAWPSLDDFRRMSPADVNAFFESQGMTWRVAAPAAGLPAAEQGLREALRRRHAEVCACPFDGSDPGCNLLMDGAELAALAAPATGLPAAEGLREALRKALPRAINFRFLPPRVITDPIWDEVAAELAAEAEPECVCEGEFPSACGPECICFHHAVRDGTDAIRADRQHQ